MNEANPLQSRLNRVLFPRLSIQYRLPLLICILLLIVIIAISWTSYYHMKQSAREAGQQRLLTLTEQLSSMFQQSARQVRANMRSTASHEAIRNYLTAPVQQNKDSSYELLKKLQTDTTVMRVQLLNLDRQPVLSIGKTSINIDIDSSLRATSAAPEFTTVGKLYARGDSMYYPIIVAVTHNNNKPIGHIVQWRLVTATKSSLEQLSKIIGTDAVLYIGNYDGSLWTNMMHPVNLPPFTKTAIPNIVEYKRGGNEMIASVRSITNTNWMVMVEFPRASVDEAANNFLYYIMGAGLVLLAISIFLAWTMSKNITRPLKQLTSAATAIASGTRSTEVSVDRYDELGKLALAFNAMSVQVQNAQRDLEKKVKDRTAQLESVNKELEAFSYSVSHDLRAPLRAVSGYAQMLQEDYGPKLDVEANRVINAIMHNAHMMGQLIDDLIAFSRISRKELAHNPIDMMQLAETCVNEVQETSTNRKYQVKVNDMPACFGDQSMMKQVWLNLISNAVKYSSHETKPEIEIGYKDEGNGHHVYFVKDNGVGFDMQYAHKLFGVFQRLHSPDAFEGTGVGLALAKRIINKHAGDIWAESAPGKGATFFISLPKTALND